MALPAKTRRGSQRVSHHETTINLASIEAESVDATNDVSCRGARVGDGVIVNWSNEAHPLSITGYVSAENVVTIQAANASQVSVDASSATFYITIIHR